MARESGAVGFNAHGVSARCSRAPGFGTAQPCPTFMKITRDEARHIADLAHLDFDDAALERMAAEMTKILTYIDQLREIDAAEGGSAPLEATPLREDTSRPGIARDAVERNAPAWRDGHFVVPKVIE